MSHTATSLIDFHILETTQPMQRLREILLSQYLQKKNVQL